MQTKNVQRLTGRSRRFLSALLLGSLLGLVPLASSAAADEPTITFNGAGFGHGVGLSQWGAFGRASDSENPQSYTEILADYFQGSTLETFGAGVPDPGNVFVNAGSDRTSTTLTIRGVPGVEAPPVEVVSDPMAAEPKTQTLSVGDEVTISDQTPTKGNPGGCNVSLRVDGVDTAWVTNGSCDVTIGLTRLSSVDTPPDFLIEATNCDRPYDCAFGYGVAFRTVDNASGQRSVPDTYTPNGLTYQGFDLVVEMDLDEYTLGVKEVYYSWPSEALKAMAVTARSYAAALAFGPGHESAGCFCDLKTTSSWQVYIGYKIGLADYDRWASAATDTASVVLHHPVAPDGGIIMGYHSSSNGGASESSVDKWVQDLPYLVTVDDPWSLVPQNSASAWSFTYTTDYVVDKVWGSGSSNVLTAAEVVQTNASGSAKAVRFEAEQSNGSTVEVVWTLKSGKVKDAFPAVAGRSWYFSIDDSELEPELPPPPTMAASVAVQDPRTGIWTMKSADGSLDSFYYGDPQDYPFVGDWNGNGNETVGLYRRSTGFLFLRNTNTQGIADIDIYYGIPGDIPVAGDWNGDGTDTVGIFRPSDGKFYLRNTNTQGIADVVVPFGKSGDQPIAGDWNGDGRDTVGVYRPSNKTVYLTDSIETGTVSMTFYYSGTASGDRVITGDWDNDGDDTLGVFRPSNATFYLRDTYTQSSANIIFTLGRSWMNPVAGNWSG